MVPRWPIDAYGCGEHLALIISSIAVMRRKLWPENRSFFGQKSIFFGFSEITTDGNCLLRFRGDQSMRMVSDGYTVYTFALEYLLVSQKVERWNSISGPRCPGFGSWGWKTFSTRASHVVTHRTTGLARIILTSEIGRDRVHYDWYDRTYLLRDN